MKLLADILGALGIFIAVVLYQQKKKESMLFYKMLLDIIWALHYCCIGAFSGAAVAGIAALREIVFMKRDPKKRGGTIWLAVFITIAIVSTILTWKNIFSIFSLVASCVAVVGFFIGKPKLSRILAFPVSASMLTYDVACGSMAGVINESFAMISSAIGIWRHDRNKNPEEIPDSEEDF